MSAFTWKDTLPTAATAALAGALAGMPMKALELHQRRKRHSEPEQPTVVNNYYPQAISPKAAAMLKTAFGWEEVLPQAVGKGIGDLGGKLTSSALEAAWPKKPKPEKEKPKGQIINNYHIPPELLAQLAQKTGGLKGERLAAFNVGIEAFCKEAGFDAEDTVAMTGLARRTFVEKTADFLGIGSWWDRMKTQGKDNPLGTFGAVNRDLQDSSHGLKGKWDDIKDEWNQAGNVTADENRKRFMRAYRAGTSQGIAPRDALGQAAGQMGAAGMNFMREMEADKEHFPELQRKKTWRADQPWLGQTNVSQPQTSNPGAATQTAPATPVSAPAAPTAGPSTPAAAPSAPVSTASSPEPDSNLRIGPRQSTPAATPKPSADDAWWAQRKANEPGKDGRDPAWHPQPQPAATPSSSSSPETPVSAPVSTAASNVPGGDSAMSKPKNPNVGIYVSQAGTDKSYLKNFKQDGGTIGTRGKATLPLPGFSH